MVLSSYLFKISLVPNGSGVGRCDDVLLPATFVEVIWALGVSYSWIVVGIVLAFLALVKWDTLVSLGSVRLTGASVNHTCHCCGWNICSIIIVICRVWPTEKYVRPKKWPNLTWIQTIWAGFGGKFKSSLLWKVFMRERHSAKRVFFFQETLSNRLL